jgi:putative ABC transport system substrate-binding protein
MPVDVIVTATTAGTRAAMEATRTLPIVMAATADPVATGLVASLARPGGNVTGLSLQTPDVASKRLQLAREIVPGAERIALLAEKTPSPTQGTTASLVSESAAAAKTLGVALIVRDVDAAHALPEAFDAFRREKAQALIVQVSPLLVEHRATIVALASRNRLPAIYEARNFVDAGGLASYGPDLRATYRRAADYVDRILRGARPGDLPVEQPERIALVVNLSAAKALGLTLPDAVMLQAETVSRPAPR